MFTSFISNAINTTVEHYFNKSHSYKSIINFQLVYKNIQQNNLTFKKK